MNTTLSSRARTLTAFATQAGTAFAKKAGTAFATQAGTAFATQAGAAFAAAGVTTLVATLAMAVPAGAAGSSTIPAEPPRITVSSAVSCSPSDEPFVVEFFYDDHVDGHVPQAVHEEVVEGSTVVWTRDDLYQEHGNYFNVVSYPQGVAPLNQTSTFTYTVTIRYDDGVTQSQSTTVDVAAAECPEPPPTPGTTAPPTTAPTGGATLPATGTGDTIWILGAIAGLLMAAGAALFAGVRRTRVD